MGLVLSRYKGQSVIIDNHKLTVTDVGDDFVDVNIDGADFRLIENDFNFLSYGEFDIKLITFGAYKDQARLLIEAPDYIAVDRLEIYKKKYGEFEQCN